MTTDERFEFYLELADKYGPYDRMTLAAWFFYVAARDAERGE